MNSHNKHGAWIIFLSVPLVFIGHSFICHFSHSSYIPHSFVGTSHLSPNSYYPSFIAHNIIFLLWPWMNSNRIILKSQHYMNKTTCMKMQFPIRIINFQTQNKYFQIKRCIFLLEDVCSLFLQLNESLFESFSVFENEFIFLFQVIYTIFSPEFRHAFKRLLCGRRNSIRRRTGVRR